MKYGITIYYIHVTTWMNFQNMIYKKTPNTKDHKFYDSIYMKFSEKAS